jgi:hypothetical protein
MTTMLIRVFYCYAREDSRYREALQTHLAPLERDNKIVGWCDEKIEPGLEWKPEIKRRLVEADIVLLLVSPDFLASDYCYAEMQEAIKRHSEGLRVCRN